MKKYKVLISAPYFQPVVQRFKSRFDEHGVELLVPNVQERLEENDLLKIIEDLDGILCGDDRITEKVLSQAKKLKVISKWGTGIDSIDQNACKKYGVKLCNTPNAFTIPVSDTVLAYALAFCRNVASMDRQMKNGVWKKIPGFTLSEATFGIIGVGNIGSMVAKKLVPFGCKILGYDKKSISKEILSNTGMKEVSLEELLSQSDFVSLNCDLNESSKYLMNKKTFSMMKKTAYLINTARGPIVNENDLIDALEKGVIAGAGLDVFEHEPLPLSSKLIKMDQVLIAPHNSNSSPTAWEKVHENTIRQLLGELK